MRTSYLYRKIIVSGQEGQRSRTAESLTLGSVGGWPVHRQDAEYLLFINRSFLNITKHLKFALFIEKNIIVFQKNNE